MNNDIGSRIDGLITSLKIKKVRFAERLGIDQSYVTQLTSGRRNPSDLLIGAICREFNVNEKWLRTGEGEMMLQQTRNEEISAFLNELLAEESTDFRLRLVTALSRLSPQQWDALESLALNLLETAPHQPEAPQKEPEPEREKILRFRVPEYMRGMSAGTGQEAALEFPQDLELTKAPPRGTSYAARVIGNSMAPTYQDGDLVFVHSCEEIPIGRVGVFFMDGQQWVKELGDGILISHNPAYPPRPITEGTRCQGLVLGVCDESYFE